MSIHRKNPRRDVNEAAIKAALIQAGCSVRALSSKGVPDLLIGLRGQNYLLEIKSDKGKLTEDEIEFFDTWKGQAAVVRSVTEALQAVNLIPED